MRPTRFRLPGLVLFLAAITVGLGLVGETVARTSSVDLLLVGSSRAQAFLSPLSSLSTSSGEVNLLINGDMDDPRYPFYWRPTNHFVAGMWYEWFWTGAIPEFIDGGHPHHNECYPPPAPGRGCHDEGNHSQGYIRWGDGYIGGIYQPVSVIPCALYQFQIFHKNQPDPGYISKVGIDPTGQNLPPHDERDRHEYPMNCPPDYRSECPNPGLDTLDELPPHIVWSPEYRDVWDWQPLSVTAEAVSTTINVWTYTDARAVEIPPKSTYWDKGSLVPVAFPNDRLPAPTSAVPSGFITNVVAQTVLDFLIIEWDTPQPASTQVWYRILTPTVPITPTGPYFVYLPLVINGGGFSSYTHATPLDITPTTRHRVIIGGLQEGTQIEFIALSRRPLTTTCVTEFSAPVRVTIGPIPPISRAYLPMVVRGR